jgi:hypothetical protein
MAAMVAQGRTGTARMAQAGVAEAREIIPAVEMLWALMAELAAIMAEGADPTLLGQAAPLTACLGPELRD